MSSPKQNTPINQATSGRRTSFGSGNDGAGGSYFKGLEKKRRGSQTQQDLHADIMRKDTIGDVFHSLFK